MNDYFMKQDEKQLKEDMQKMSNLWGQGWIEGINDGFKCNVCQQEASTAFLLSNFQANVVPSAKMCGTAPGSAR